MDEKTARSHMVETQLIPRGIYDPQVLQAMRDLSRAAFVPSEEQRMAYSDTALPIELEQTISQPYIVALMAQAAHLQPDDVVLEIGTGSGYGAAVLSRLAKKVYTIERHKLLTEQAKERYEKLGLETIEAKTGDGTEGWAEHAPYDAIVVTARARALPTPLINQLRVGGRLVIPVGDDFMQELLLATKQEGGTLTTKTLELVRFVPLIGKHG